MCANARVKDVPPTGWALGPPSPCARLCCTGAGPPSAVPPFCRLLSHSVQLGSGISCDEFFSLICTTIGGAWSNCAGGAVAAAVGGTVDNGSSCDKKEKSRLNDIAATSKKIFGRGVNKLVSKNPTNLPGTWNWRLLLSMVESRRIVQGYLRKAAAANWRKRWFRLVFPSSFLVLFGGHADASSFWRMLTSSLGALTHCSRTHAHANARAHTHTHMNTYIHTHTRTHAHTHTRTHTQIYTRTHPHTLTQHTRTNAHIHMYALLKTHTYACANYLRMNT